MTAAEDHDLLELTELTEKWKAGLKKYQDALASHSLDDARAAESERQMLFSGLRAVVDRLRAKQPQDASIRAAWEQLSQVKGFLLFGIAAGITPYLDKLVGRSLSEWQPLVLDALDRINLRDIQNNWMTHDWPRRLLRARLTKAMTQKEAAFPCGVAEQTYERWERGEQPPAMGNIPKVLAFIQSAEEKAGSAHINQQSAPVA